MGIVVKYHCNGKLIAICDKDIIGKKFSEKGFELHVSENFYKGEEKSEAEVLRIMKEGKNINIVGKKAVSLAVKNGIVHKDSVRKIKGVPFAIVISV